MTHFPYCPGKFSVNSCDTGEPTQAVQLLTTILITLMLTVPAIELTFGEMGGHGVRS
jgi:hypothetical protein